MIAQCEVLLFQIFQKKVFLNSKHKETDAFCPDFQTKNCFLQFILHRSQKLRKRSLALSVCHITSSLVLKVIEIEIYET